MSAPARGTGASQTGSGYASTSDKIDGALLKIAAVVVLGTFMSILDTTIVNVAVNDLAQEFGSSLATIQWVATGYMLALATVIPLTGWFVERFGTKRLYIVSIVLFMAGSGLSGAAWSAESLIAFRVLQGFGGGMIMPAGMTILTQAAGPQRMGRVMGLIGVPMLIAPIMGPILGGWFVDDISWRWIFYVNIPIGVIALFAASRFLAPDEGKPGHPLDWLGVLLLSPGVAIFVFGLAEIASHGSFGSAETVIGVVLGAALVIAFVVHAARKEDALIDVHLFRRRPVASSASTSFLFATAFFGTMFLVPLYLQIVHGKSALESGLLMAPQGFGAMLTMPIAGRLTDRTGAGRIVLGGLSFIALGMFGLANTSSDTSLIVFCGFLFLNGLGMGATMMPAMSAAMRTLDHDEVARATSALNVVQRVGGALGVAILAVVLTHQLTGAVPSGAAGESGLSQLASLPPEQQAEVLPKLGDAFSHTFWWSFGIAALAYLPALFLPRQAPELPEQPHAMVVE